MQLFTSRELDIFKNFQNINCTMRIGPDQFSTKAPTNSVIAYYLWNKPDDFAPFFVYNGMNLINALNLHESDVIDTSFTTSQIVFNSPDTETAVSLSPTNVIVPPKDLNFFLDNIFSKTYAQFTLSASNLATITKATSVMKADIVRLTFDKSSVKLSTRVKDDVTTDTFSKTLPCITEFAPKYFVDISQLKLLYGHDDYTVRIGAGKNTTNYVMYFQSTTDPMLNYLIGCEPKKGNK